MDVGRIIAGCESDVADLELVDIPAGVTRWKVRIRQDDVAMITLMWGKERTETRLLERAGPGRMRPSSLVRGGVNRHGKGEDNGEETAVEADSRAQEG